MSCKILEPFSNENAPNLKQLVLTNRYALVVFSEWRGLLVFAFISFPTTLKLQCHSNKSTRDMPSCKKVTWLGILVNVHLVVFSKVSFPKKYVNKRK